MAFTAAQKSDVRFFCGWPARFHQADNALERAINAISVDPTEEALFTNAITGTPPGLLALARDVQAQIKLSTKRMKASKVGSIELNARELEQLREVGRGYTAQMCSILGVPRGSDVFGTHAANTFADFHSGSGSAGNYIGK